MAAHCQGFADQAEDLSDRMASEAARSIGELVLSSSEMKDLSARRLGSKGEMRITKEDLYHYYEDKKQRKHLLGK